MHHIRTKQPPSKCSRLQDKRIAGMLKRINKRSILRGHSARESITCPDADRSGLRLSKPFISGKENARIVSEHPLLPEERRRGFGWWPARDKNGHLSFKDLKPNKRGQRHSRDYGLESVRPFHVMSILSLFYCPQ